MKKKIFAVSDIHGHYNELRKCLDKAKFDENNESHLLVVCGDIFDRGEQSLELYNYLRELKDKGKAILVAGNHDKFMPDFLDGHSCAFNFLYNGFNKTLDSFLNETSSYQTFLLYINEFKEEAVRIYGDRVKPLLGDPSAIPSEVLFDVYEEYARDYIKREYKDLYEFLSDLPYYYETENYIFTHASIDTECEDWKNPTFTKYEDWSPWYYLTWDNGSFFGKEIKNTDKTVVVGHYHTDGIREKYSIETDFGSNSILRRDDNKVIMIDACTPLTRRVNVLIIDDEDLL